jgi:hypothetical protein
MTQSDREIFFICDNLTKFSNDIDDQNLLLVTVPKVDSSCKKPLCICNSTFMALVS